VLLVRLRCSGFLLLWLPLLALLLRRLLCWHFCNPWRWCMLLSLLLALGLLLRVL
jgi:hypothetical protein